MVGNLRKGPSLRKKRPAKVALQNPSRPCSSSQQVPLRRAAPRRTALASARLGSPSERARSCCPCLLACLHREKVHCRRGRLVARSPRRPPALHRTPHLGISVPRFYPPYASVAFTPLKFDLAYAMPPDQCCHVGWFILRYRSCGRRAGPERRQAAPHGAGYD